MRILGIDIGSGSVRAVEYETSFRKYEVVEYHEKGIPDGTAPELVVRGMIASLQEKPEKVIVCLRTGECTTRLVTLPTKDRKAIQNGVGFEIEDDVPFSEDEMLYEYAILSQSNEGSRIHVATTSQTRFREKLSSWSDCGIDAEIVSSESWAYRSLFNRVLAQAPEERPLMMIQVGHKHTTFYVHHQSNPILISSIPVGGHHLTLAVCKKYEIAYEQAETAKLDHGFIITQAGRDRATPEQLTFSDVLEEPIREIAQEARRLMLASKTITRENVGSLYLSGLASLLPGLSAWFQEELHLPVKNLKSLSAVTQSGITYSEKADAAFSLAAGLGLMAVGPDKSNILNFRKGKFAKAGKSSTIHYHLIKSPLIATCIVLVCAMISLSVQKSHYETKIKTVRTQLEKSVRGFFPDLSASAVRQVLTNVKSLKTQIDKELNKQKELNRLLEPNSQSPLAFIRQLSQAVEKTSIVDLIEFQMGAAPIDSYQSNKPQPISLTFVLSDPAIADRVESVLKSKLQQVSRSKAEPIEIKVPATTEKGSKATVEKKWKIIFSGKTLEQGYASN